MSDIEKEILGRLTRIETTLFNLGGMYAGMGKSWESYLTKDEKIEDKEL